MNYGEALAAVKSGKRIARSGWNGKNMFVFIKKGSVAPDAKGVVNESAHTINGVSTQLFDFGDVGTTTRMPCLCLRAADGSTVEGWLASQTDMLAEDWVIGA